MAKEIDAVPSVPLSATAASVNHIKKELNKKVMAILKNKLQTNKLWQMFGFCHHYWSFWQLNGLSLNNELYTTEFMLFNMATKRPHKQLQSSFSQSKSEWMVFFLRPSHVIFFKKKGNGVCELWQLIEWKEKKKTVVNRDLEIILWKSANDAANGAVLQLGNRNANSCSGGKFLALIGASVTMPEAQAQRQTCQLNASRTLRGVRFHLYALFDCFFAFECDFFASCVTVIAAFFLWNSMENTTRPLAADSAALRPK